MRRSSSSLASGLHLPDREGRLPTATLGPKKPKGHFKGDRVTREGIFELARELFGAIRTGRTGRGINGQYDRGADVTRTAQYGQGSSPRMRAHYPPSSSADVYFVTALSIPSAFCILEIERE